MRPNRQTGRRQRRGAAAEGAPRQAEWRRQRTVPCPLTRKAETVALSITLCPTVDGLLFDAIAVVEFALLMVCVSTTEVLALKLVSPHMLR
jgi:hypothetical protein